MIKINLSFEKIGFLFLTVFFLTSCGGAGPTVVIKNNGVEIGLAIKPAKPISGENQFKVILKDEKGPVQNAKVRVEYFMPAMGTMPAMQGSSQAEPTGNGEYSATLALPMEGDWTITVRTNPNSKGLVVAPFHIRTGSKTITAEQ